MRFVLCPVFDAARLRKRTGEARKPSVLIHAGTPLPAALEQQITDRCSLSRYQLH
jgi:hypothetical protein